MARFITARRTGRERLTAGRRQFAARRLNPAERAAQFINLTLVGKLLALGDLDQFQHLVQMVDHALEGLGNLGGVLDRLADGRGFGQAEIGWLDPRLRAQRFGTALRPLAAVRFALVALISWFTHLARFRLRPGFRRGKIF